MKNIFKRIKKNAIAMTILFLLAFLVLGFICAIYPWVLGILAIIAIIVMSYIAATDVIDENL